MLVTVNVNDDLHKKAKELAEQNKVLIGRIYDEALAEYIKKHEGKK